MLNLVIILVHYTLELSAKYGKYSEPSQSQARASGGALLPSESLTLYVMRFFGVSMDSAIFFYRSLYWY